MFDEALLLEPQARNAYLDRTCAHDAELRRHLRRLLAAHDDSASFLDRSPEALLGIDGPDDGILPEPGRFRIGRRLGAGGMGVVHEAYDGERKEHVALKSLRRSTPADLYWLKREFRTLAGVVHSNLVCLYELFVEDDRAFFTMELVNGRTFVEFVRDTDRAHRVDDRLGGALRQLIEGVLALHRKGKLHRDIKPSNVLVTRAGRVVILDFGLVADRNAYLIGRGQHVAGGTPAYVAPEEAAGAPPSEASDWYGVGVTFYEALTGHLPFSGSVPDVLRRKQVEDPVPPHQLAPDVPANLSALCMRLLSRDPDRRANGSDALRGLDRRAAPRPTATSPIAARASLFVGRTRELDVLRHVWSIVATGEAASVCLHGPSGIGKSALVRHFLAQASADERVVVLAGRCYETESVPFKALDGVVDALSQHLKTLSPASQADVLPSDLEALMRIFPVLRQTEAVTDAPRHRRLGNVDPVDLRLRAFAALSELLRRLAHQRPLVVSIDDLQWADADSIVLLDQLLHVPAGPAMLTLLSFRSEEVAAKPFLQALLARSGQSPWLSLALSPLADEEADALIRDLVAGPATLSDDERAHIAHEAQGSPFVLEQLAWHSGGAGPSSEAVTLARVLDVRLASLSIDARNFLDTLAICARPMSPVLLCDVCGVERDRQSLEVILRAQHFIRSSGSSAWVEPYHDRIREALVARLAPDDVRRRHGLMAQALVSRGSDDCEALFEHYHGAGEAERASVQAARSAEKATGALAFDRAASFYRHALKLMPASASRLAWQEALADALAHAGRPAEAAEAYLAAATGADRTKEVELQRRGAEQFLIGGHIDRGLDQLHHVLERVGERAARGPGAALWSLLWHRARLRWRGLQFVTTQAEDIDPERLLRVDTCWSATAGLLLVDLVTAADFSARHLRLALDAGDPRRVARAMAFESAQRSVDFTDRRLSARLREQAQVLATRTGDPHVRALLLLVDAVTAAGLGEWKQALEQSERAVRVLRNECVGFTWEMNIAQNLVIWALMYLGELGEVSRRVPALLAEARSRGNLYLATELCTRSNYAWLVADDPDGGEREVLASMARWSQRHFHRQHYSAMLARVQTALYRGDAQGAWNVLDEHAVQLRRSHLTRIHVFRVECHYLRARAALAMAAATTRPEAYLSRARACANAIASERMPWSDPISRLLQACIANLAGLPAEARRYLVEAADGFDRADMRLYAAVARRRLGELEPSVLREQAEAWMIGQTIKNPARLTAMLAPGFDRL